MPVKDHPQAPRPRAPHLQAQGLSASSLAALEALLTPPSSRTHTEPAAQPGDSSCIVPAGPTSFLVPLVQDHVTHAHVTATAT